MSEFSNRIRDVLRDWRDDPCAGEDDLARRVDALCHAVAAEAAIKERSRIHAVMRSTTRARVAVEQVTPRDEHEETTRTVLPPLTPTWPPGAVVTPLGEGGPTLTTGHPPADPEE